MPKEKPCLSEHGCFATSSKNAKDKSNSTTLLALRNAKDTDDSRGRGSNCSSEKDSGYSDVSDWQQTDVEDQHSNKSQSRGSECAETSQPGQNRERGRGNPVNLTLMPAGHELPSIYIIKNMVLKPPGMIQKRGQLLWRNKSRETGSSGAPHMILFQQPNLLPTTLQVHKPLSRKSNITGKKINGTYLPIFNSYPRIAPHPSKKPPDKSSSKDESQNLSKRVCTEQNSDNTPVTQSLPAQHLYKQPKLAVSASGQQCSSSTRDGLSSSSSATASSSQGSPSVPSMHTTSSSSFLATRGLHRNSNTSTRHRRFLNTVEILRQSGLLDITLRTKELLRQSNASEQDIAQLRQHTELLCQAASNPSCSLNGITVFECLHKAMAESSSYPNLKLLQNLQIPSHPDSAGQKESIATVDAKGPLAAENSDVPQSRLLTAILDPSQNCLISQQSQSQRSRKLEAGEKTSENVTFMPPDSSTG
ncbi:CLOCK-interacting pacemaker-like isoform X1 [Xiphias gladius]|uniref:CLOCK-interacting pacemaker-like isoform X1 n=1 Tax=Xiphias gladius TaxID=8245 RepID=UPI001A99CB6C|nr:CLOCK-interacting pacemaker-like isoform X1 [Xiphias gladius]XP_039987467.1 CLOCK-interacting pacemaker-like isoform X1 [Xiphias gladius]XP_039987468.1 CLOCK-interacting pacemaker-like isoform X1 [Xiphias gladius]XP_039987469.1 CLOCK-interacting pacemaker-like isoform X1 [Xiphias gladius]XP_039987470.1 CLOCK-interacting pacemaker-like isoform X1 [Xiphias gladius]XP_039987471.1 CLOCK-interacting pacemaker-like isoform X1 [Xiphias gladius]XP_039987472.1 CLOCK-interacting pacemaker-like isofo